MRWAAAFPAAGRITTDYYCMDWTIPRKRLGEVLRRIELPQFCFACMLGGADGKTLFVLIADWSGTENIGAGPRTGKIATAPAPAAHAGWP